jgi:hypothetical protein
LTERRISAVTPRVSTARSRAKCISQEIWIATEAQDPARPLAAHPSGGIHRRDQDRHIILQGFPCEFCASIAEDVPKWREIIARAGIKPV